MIAERFSLSARMFVRSISLSIGRRSKRRGLDRTHTWGRTDKLYEDMRDKRVHVDLDVLCSELGVYSEGQKVRLNERAHFAAIRRRITGDPRPAGAGAGKSPETNVLVSGNDTGVKVSKMAAGLFYETDLFKDVAESCLQVLLEDSHVLNVGVGHLFFSAGQLGGELFLLEKGSVQTFRLCGDKKIAIATLQPPAVFGEMGCFGRSRHYISAESAEDSQVRLISGNTIQTLMECSPNLAHAVIGLISERFDRFLCEFEAHALKGTIPRLATLLLTKEEEHVVTGLTHKDLAQELGIHRESVTAALGELQRADIIEIGRKKIRILHRARLERATRE